MRDMILNEVTLEKLDLLIRQGKTAVAARHVRALSQKTEISRPIRLKLARLARRAFVPAIGLRLLRPFVRPSARSREQASPEEKLEFAACLIWVDAFAEALKLLDSISPEKYPQVLLFRSFAHFANWDYALVVPLLREYVKAPGLDPYTRLVGKTNLATALVHERFTEEAETLLAEIESAAREGNHQLLLGNILRFQAENSMYSANWMRARERIRNALQFSTSAGSADILFFRKWQAILGLYTNQDRAESIRELDRVRAFALDLKKWEAIRDCDYHQAVCTRDQDLALKLIFGTPFPAYRQRLILECPWLEGRVPQEYEREIGGPSGRKRGKCAMSVRDGANSVSSLHLKEGHVPQRLLRLLASDFYKPKSMGDLFSQLFEGRYFNPVTAPQCIHQANKRLRKFFSDSGVPLTIKEDRSTYFLEAKAPVILKLDRPEGSGQPCLRKRCRDSMEQIRKRFGGSLFSVHDASSALGISDRLALNLVQEAMEAGAVEKVGKTRAARYRFEG